MTIELSIEELKAVRDVLAIIDVFKMTLKVIKKNHALETLKSRLDSFLGDPYKKLKREEYEAAIMQFYENDPKKLARALKMLEKDFPLPEAYRH